jgi:hypothetical protein
VLGSGIGDVVIVGIIVIVINVREATSEESSFVRESRGCR